MHLYNPIKKHTCLFVCEHSGGEKWVDLEFHLEREVCWQSMLATEVETLRDWLDGAREIDSCHCSVLPLSGNT